MVLADIKTSADESAWHNWFHGGRFVLVRYIDGSTGEQLRTEAETAKAAALALATDKTGDRVLTVR